MKPLRLFLIVGLPLLQSICLWGIFIVPSWALWLLGALFLLTDALLLLMTPKDLTFVQRFTVSWPSLVAGPALGLLLIFLDVRLIWPRVVLIVIHGLLQGIVLLHMYYKFYRIERYHERSLAHSTDYLNTFSLFCSALSLFAAVYFLDFALWMVLPPFALVAITFVLQSLLINDFNLKTHAYFLFGFSLALVELTTALLWLPSLYYVNALFVTLFYSSALALCLPSFRKELRRNDIIGVMAFAAAVLLFVITTTRWR